MSRSPQTAPSSMPAGRTRDRTGDEVVAAYREACVRSDEIVRASPDLATMATTGL